MAELSAERLSKTKDPSTTAKASQNIPTQPNAVAPSSYQKQRPSILNPAYNLQRAVPPVPQQTHAAVGVVTPKGPISTDWMHRLTVLHPLFSKHLICS